jgi:hypothetical protein
MGTDVPSSLPTLEGRGRALYEKCSGPRENLIEDMERLDRSPPARGGRQTSFPHIGIYLAAARGTEVFAPAGATFEMIRRTLVKIAVRVAPMIDAARAAASPHFNHKTRSDCRRGVPRAAHDLRRWLADAEGDCVGLEARRGSRGYRSHP